MARQRERTVTVLSIVITLVLIAAFVVFSNSPISLRVRTLVGLDDRLRPAVEATDGAGSFAFLFTQEGTNQPVGFNPCRTIPYVVNPRDAPDGWKPLVDSAIAEVSDRTGLEFDDRGTTSDRGFSERLTGSGPEPVIIAWADSDEVAGLADDVAGLGGPTMVELAGRRAYVTGSVVLDTETTDRLAAEPGGDQRQLALLLHELGHLVGLDHVDDRGELMYPRSAARTTYGAGDLTGLAELGAIPCG